MLRWLLLTAVLACAPGLVRAADPAAAPPDAPPVLAALDGAPELFVRAADGSVRKLHEGDSFAWGDSFQTGTDAVARVQFRSGANALVLAGSSATLPSALDADPPGITLETGEARAVVPKAPAAQTQGQNGAPARLRFFFRTRTAVMGVRGTDFVVAAGPQGSSVHTLDGSVELGKSVAELHAGMKVDVAQGTFSEARPGAALAPAKAFDRKAFIQGLVARQPRMRPVVQKTYQEMRSGTQDKRFGLKGRNRAQYKGKGPRKGRRKPRPKAAPPKEDKKSR
jgi:hypothetical protein